MMKEKNRASQIDRNWFAADRGRLKFSPIQRRLHRRFQRFLGADDGVRGRDRTILGNVAIKLNGPFQVSGGRILRKMHVTGKRAFTLRNDRRKRGSGFRLGL